MTGTGCFPSAGRSTSPSFRSGALEGGVDASWRRVGSAGAVRAASEGRPPTRHDPLELAGHGRPDDDEQLATNDLHFLLARRAGTLSFRPSGHPAPPPQGAPFRESLPMAFVGRRASLNQARCLNPAFSVERPTQGAVSG